MHDENRCSDATALHHTQEISTGGCHVLLSLTISHPHTSSCNPVLRLLPLLDMHSLNFLTLLLATMHAMHRLQQFLVEINTR